MFNLCRKKILSSLFSVSGFTLIELVVVLILLSIVSVYAIPRMFSVQDYRDKAAITEVAEAIKYTQRLATNSTCLSQIVIGGDNYIINQFDSCIGVVASPINQYHPISTKIMKDVSIHIRPDTTLTFDGLGRIEQAYVITIGNYQFTVHEMTGAITWNP